MREFPDKFFDLAVVDPPYGDGSSQNVQVEREREREPEAVEPLRSAVRPIQAPDGRDGTCRADTPVTHTHTHTARPEQAEPGLKSTPKKL